MTDGSNDFPPKAPQWPALTTSTQILQEMASQQQRVMAEILEIFRPKLPAMLKQIGLTNDTILAFAQSTAAPLAELQRQTVVAFTETMAAQLDAMLTPQRVADVLVSTLRTLERVETEREAEQGQEDIEADDATLPPSESTASRMAGWITDIPVENQVLLAVGLFSIVVALSLLIIANEHPGSRWMISQISDGLFEVAAIFLVAGNPAAMLRDRDEDCN